MFGFCSIIGIEQDNVYINTIDNRRVNKKLGAVAAKVASVSLHENYDDVKVVIMSTILLRLSKRPITLYFL